MDRNSFIKNRIVIIAHSLHTGGGYTSGLAFIRSLKNIVENEKFLVIVPGGVGYEEIQLPEGSEYFIYTEGRGIKNRFKFDLFKLPKIIKRYNADVVLGWANFGIPNINIPQAVLIRQAYLFYPSTHYPNLSFTGKLRLFHRKWMIKRSLPYIDKIFVQTPVVKERFCTTYKYPRENTIVVPFAVPNITIPPEDKLPKLPEGKKIIFVPTRYLSHRNPSVLIELCKVYSKQLKDKYLFITTVEINDHPDAKKFLDNISKYKLDSMILNIGHLSHPNVIKYMVRSDVMLFPSFIETLGLPYLEAMQCRLPILTHDFDFARYVCGKSALYYNPYDLNDLFNKLKEITINEDLRNELKLSADSELKKFSSSWEETAKMVLKQLKMLIKQRKR